MSASHKKPASAKAAAKAVPAKPAPPLDASAAFEAVQAEMAQLDSSDLVSIRIDVPTAVSVVLGSLPAVQSLREYVVVQLPEFALAFIDKLETYALAAWYAHLVALPAPAGNKQVKDLVEEALPLRATLLSDADALARRGLLSVEVINGIRAGQGHIDIANDLVALAALFSTSWSDIEGKTAATMTEVERAAQLGPQLLAALGVRDQTRVSPGEAADRRVRAFSVMVRAYDQTRRAVSYLRWDEGDADTIAPSLYKGRGGRGSSDTAEAKPEDAPPGEAKGTPAGEANGKPVAPVDPAAANGKPAAPAAVNGKPAAPAAANGKPVAPAGASSDSAPS